MNAPFWRIDVTNSEDVFTICEDDATLREINAPKWRIRLAIREDVLGKSGVVLAICEAV